MISSKCLPIAGILLLGASVLLQSCGDSPGAGNSGAGGSRTGGAGGSASGSGGSVNSAGGSASGSDGSVNSAGGSGGSPVGSGGSATGTGGSLGGSGGAGTSPGGSSGSPVGSGGLATGAGGSLGGSGGAGTSPGGTGACAPRTSATMAVHLIMDVTWPSTLGTSGGTGKFHIWNLTKISTSGTALSGTNQPCGSAVPETTLAAIVGGGKFLVEVPSAFWDAQPPLQFPLAGTQSGWTMASTFVSTGDPALVGLSMTDPNATWPSSYTSITAVDVDKDSKPGLTAIPKSGAGYVNPPLSILGSAGAKADQVYVATRTEVDMDGAFTSCTDQSGKAVTKYLDNHVVGCHVAGGGECSAAQTKFLDDNRTAFTVTGGAYVAKIVPDTATCSDVRNAVP